MTPSSTSRGPLTEKPRAMTWGKIWPWFVLLGMGLVACVLGFVGFKKQALIAQTGDTLPDLIYKTLQLFVLESGYVQGGVGWQLEIARILAPLVPAWAALQTLRLLFRDQRESFWMRRRKDHVVICGLGRKGFQLVRDFRKAGEDVVVIECNNDNAHLTGCRDLGARVISGSCRDMSLLRKARVDRARHLVLITGDDGTNIETAILAHKLLGDLGNKAGFTVRCHVHVVNLKLSHLLKSHDLLSAPDVKLKTRIFNSFQNSARALFEAHPLDPAGFVADDERSVHLVVFGFGQMGEAVVLQAAKIGHFANRKAARITVIDSLADERESSFRN